MKNCKEAARTLALMGILASSASACGTKYTEIPIEKLSADPCGFAGQAVETTGFTGNISEALIYTQIHQKPTLCTPSKAVEVFSMDTEYYECIDRSTVFQERMNYSFKLKPGPGSDLPFTNVIYTSNLYATGAGEYSREQDEIRENLLGKVTIKGVVQRADGKCYLLAKDLSKTE